MAGLLELSAEQVLALAPDASARTAARSVAKASIWQGLGRSMAALWGECRGSAVYQVRVGLGDLAGKCSCPSRKFPCKHTVGLLLMAAESSVVFAEAAEPEWVASWLLQKGAAAEKKLAKEKAPSAPPADPKAQARRAERRHLAVAAGIDGLQLWMSDLVRQGLATLPAHSDIWEQQAARLVDAQAPGLAARVRAMGELPGTPGWSERLLAELGATALLCRAYQRIATLDPALAADVRQLVGFNLERDDVALAGDLVRDRWAVMGQWIEDADRLRIQRSWLRGEQSGRRALVLQFSPGKAPFPQQLIAGTVIEAELAFWPSAFPLRAIVRELGSQVGALSTRLPGHESVSALLDDAAYACAAQPWIDRIPCVLRDVVPLPEPWRVVDREGRALRFACREGWTLVAQSGGRPFDVVGEWDGRALRPLAVFADERFHQVRS